MEVRHNAVSDRRARPGSGATFPVVDPAPGKPMTAFPPGLLPLLVGVSFVVVGVFLCCYLPRPDWYRTTTAPAQPPAPHPDEHTAPLPRIFSHSEPARPLDTGEAHRTMQLHVACRADSCPRKRSALQTLIAAGRLVPDCRAEHYLIRN